MITLGQTYTHQFSFTQAQVQAFAEVSGDNNPLHLDAEFAATTPFKKPIMHGFLGGSIFSMILGTKFPGEGSVYLKQSMELLKP
jgi:acyl dehydratase